jgi:hypothetical protein
VAYTKHTTTEWFEQTILDRVLKLKVGSASATASLSWNLLLHRWTTPQITLHHNVCLGLTPGLERLVRESKELLDAMASELPAFTADTNKMVPNLTIYPDKHVKGQMNGTSGELSLNHANCADCCSVIKAEICVGALTNYNFTKSQTNVGFSQNNLHLPDLTQIFLDAGFRLTGRDEETRKYLWRALFRLHPAPAERSFRQLAAKLMPLRTAVTRNWEVAVWGNPSTHPLNREIVFLSPGHGKFVDMCEYQSKGGIMKPFPQDEEQNLQPLQTTLDTIISETLNQANASEKERLRKLNNPFANEQLRWIREIESRLDKEIKYVS